MKFDDATWDALQFAWNAGVGRQVACGWADPRSLDCLTETYEGNDALDVLDDAGLLEVVDGSYLLTREGLSAIARRNA